MSTTISIDSISDLPYAAEKIIESLGEHTVVAFYGGMGAGKTTLIREISSQLKVTDTVTSPTFAIVNQYDSVSGRRIFHFDFYRIEKLSEAYDMGYEEYFYSGDLCLVEWPEKIEPLLPDDVLRVRIETSDDDRQSRTVTIF